MKSRRLFLPAGLCAGLYGMLVLSAGAAEISKVLTVESMNTEAGWAGGKVPGSGDIAVFSGANGTTGTFTLEDDLAINGMKFGWVATMPVTFNGDSTLSIGAGGMPQVDRTSASPIVFNHDLLLTASQKWIAYNAYRLSINRNLKGAEGVTLLQDVPADRGYSSADTFIYLNASNSFAGTIESLRGAIKLNNATGSVCSAQVLVRATGLFEIFSPSGYPPAEGLRGNRVTLDNGRMIVGANSVANADERFSGSLTLLAGIGDISCQSSSYGTRLSFSSLERMPGGGVVVFHGNNIGESAYPTAGKCNILFDTPPRLIGGGGAYGSTTVKILPYALCNDYNTGSPENLVTYDAAYGVRQVTSYAGTLVSGSVSATNYQLTATVNITGPTVVNALKLGANGRVEGSGELTVSSGVIFAVANSSIGTNTPGTLAFGDEEGIISLDASSRTLSIGSAITGTKGMTKSSSGTLALLGPVNVGGPVSFMNNTLNLGSAVNGALNVNKATVNLLSGSAVREGFNAYQSSTVNLLPNATFSGRVSATNTCVINLQPGSSVSGEVSVVACSLNMALGSTVTGTVSASSASTVNNGGGTIVGSLVQNGSTLNLSSNAVVRGSVTAVSGTLNATNSTVTGSVNVSASGTANLRAGTAVDGSINIASGTVNLDKGAAFAGSVTNFGTFNYNLSDAAPMTIALDGTGTFYHKNVNAPLTIYQPSGDHLIGNVSVSAGATLILDGEPDAVTIMTNNTFGPVNVPYVINGGTWAWYLPYYTPYTAYVQADVTLNGGVLTAAPGSRLFAFYNPGGSNTLTITGGTLMDRPDTTWSLRFGNLNGSWDSNTGCDFTGKQSGGTVLAQSGEYFHLGSLANNKTATYDLSGGTVYAFGRFTDRAVHIGSGTNNSLTAFTLSGTGKLVSSGIISGISSGDTAQQIFAFKGGTLATREINMTNLRPVPDGARGTLFNEGGTLAPGDLGAPGKTTVTGSYTSAPSATLAFELGGTAQANAFTNAAGYYDHLLVTGTAAFQGALRVSLINGFVPGPASVFYAVSAYNPILFPSGGFANAAGNRLWAEDGFTRFELTYPEGGKHVVLGNAALNQWAGAAGGDWDAEGAWSVTNPATAEYGAYFGPNLASAGTVTVNAPRALRGLAFNSAASYTLSGAGTLTLASGGAYGMPRIQSLQGSHTVAAALVLQDALTVNVTNAAGVLTLSGGVTGGKDLTKLGAGTLALSGDNVLGAVTVSGGTLRQAAGGSAFGSLDIAAGAAYSLYAETLTLAGGLTVAAGGAFDFGSYGAGTLRLRRGAAGGALDTAAEFWAAAADGRVTVKGQDASDASVFILKEEEDGGVWYVTVTLKSFGTLLQFR